MPVKGYRKPATPCSIDSCENDAKSRGWCYKHYANWKRTGDPIPRLRPHYGRGRRVTEQGYVEVWDPVHPLAYTYGYVLEHRKVAWDAGILTDPSMHVHHLDHDKQNNAVENLEVKTPQEHAAHHAQEDGYIINQYGTWEIGKRDEAQKKFRKKRQELHRAAAQALGIGVKEYRALYGYSVRTAEKVIDEQGQGL